MTPVVEVEGRRVRVSSKVLWPAAGFEPRTALERLERLGDLFRPVLGLRQRLPAAVT